MGSVQDEPLPSAGNAAKIAFRDRLVTARGHLGLAQIAERARLAAAVLVADPAFRRAATIAAYVGVGREPGTGPLLDAAQQAGKRVILPVLLPDNDLEWAQYDGPESLQRAGRGLLEPVTPLLGPDAIGGADLVLVPGLAVGADGTRLGRGGGSYDRALARVPVGTDVWVVLNHEELLDEVPSEPHDRPVTGALTDLGIRRFGSYRVDVR